MIDIKTLASGSKGNAYLIDDGQSQLLLECGINYKEIQRQMNFDTSRIVGCLLTHEHKDHSKGLKDVVRAGINTYMSKGTANAEGINHHRIKTVKNKQQFKVGTWTILPFDIQHDVSEPFGFLVMNEQGEKLLFATDTYYVKYSFKGLNYIMIECNYSQTILDDNIANGRVPQFMRKRLMKSHFSLDNVVEFLKVNDLSQVKEIHLLHLSDTNSNAVEFKSKIQEVTGKRVIIA